MNTSIFPRRQPERQPVPQRATEPMIRVVLHTAKVFHLPDGEVHPETGYFTPGRTYTAGNGPDAQLVPAWVRDTNTWQHGVADGSIIDLADDGAMDPPAAAEAEPEQEA